MTNKKVPLLSIIVPTLNEEEHLKFLLSSLRDQILKKHELRILFKDKTSICIGVIVFIEQSLCQRAGEIAVFTQTFGFTLIKW